MRNYLLIFLAAFALQFSCVIDTYGQDYVLKGRVTDKLTTEPIPFVNVAFVGTGIGTVTDFDGYYTIKSKKLPDSLTATFVGYDPVKIKVRRVKSQTINFVMSVNKVEINEVTILAGENPADIIMRKVVDNKKKNNKDKLDSYQYEVYNKLELDITNITEEFKNKKFLRPFQFIFDNIDSTTTNDKPFLPFFISESLSDYYFKNDPRNKREIIKGAKVSGLENETVTQFLGDMYQNINIYEPYIELFNKGFVSPISGIGKLYYKYYLLDSMMIDDRFCYKLKFKPRRKGDLAFMGEMWINKGSWAVKDINMRVMEDVNINWINDLAIVQEFALVDAGAWMIVKDRLVVDFEARDDGLGFIGRKTTTYKDFIINKEAPPGIFVGTDAIVVQEQASKQNEDFWEEARHEVLSEREDKIYAMVDTIKSLPAFQSYVDIITLFITGYYEVGLIEIGPYFKMYSFNPVEGNRFRFGMRTSNSFSTKLLLGGYVAYGTRDEEFKYGANMRLKLNEKPRQWIGLDYKDDIVQLGQSSNAFAGDNILASVFRRTPPDRLTRNQHYSGYFDHEWTPGLSNRITMSNDSYKPLGKLNYTYYVNDAQTDSSDVVSTSELKFSTRFAYREKFVSGKFTRISLGSDYPIVQIDYTLGLKGVFKSDFRYHKISLKSWDRIPINPVGYTYAVLEVGKVWGALPYPLLEVHRGNESLFYDYLAFNLMNFFEFVSDSYISVFATHHFEGFFFDKIPLFRKLKWREVAAVKAIAGDLSQENIDILSDKNAFSTLSKPYVEAHLGVENILRIIRVDFIWRLSYTNDEYVAENKERFGDNSEIQKFGIRGSLALRF